MNPWRILTQRPAHGGNTFIPLTSAARLGFTARLGLTLLAWTFPLLFPLVCPAPARSEPGQQTVDFNSDVRPILSRHCFACHGPDAEHREAELRLDSRPHALQAAASGAAAIVPGQATASELVARITSTDDALRMPPAEHGPPLSPQQQQTLRTWIAEGAAYDVHWSFVPPVRPALPSVSRRDWPRTALDYFVLQRLDAIHLPPNEAADRHTLIRRLSLDLRGLPPSPVEVAAFVADDRPGAYEALVDRFLADPAYGERWARVWLDQARYADSAGYGSDPLRTIWRYRDWVIESLNANQPYDEFTRDQLAGDLLPQATLPQQIATAFHRNTMTNTEGGTDDEEFRVAAVKDRIDTTLQVWMGLTFGCAQCHNHKYDPISQREYYQLFAFFNQTADRDQPNESPTLPAPTAEFAHALARFENELGNLQTQQAALLPDLAAEQQRWEQTLRDQIAAFEKQRPQPPTVPIMVELPADQRRATHIMVAGNFLNLGEAVSPGVPAAFHPLSAPSTGEHPAGQPTRLDVARWLTDRRNPLTARVAVNRIWSQIFGVGLVLTEEDFGTQGELPSHPALLDYLAVDYMDSGWNTKRLLREIVLSATYRQTAHLSAAHRQLDPQNRWLARAPRYRLEGELVRDQALALAGLLSRRQGGPSVFPPQPDGLWRAAFNGRDRTWTTSVGADRYRRGLYTFWRRTTPYPAMSTFDAPSREICNVRRLRTNTPLQALVALNDPVFVEAAQALARRIVEQGGDQLGDRLGFAWQLCLVRPPAPTAIESLRRLYQSEFAHFQADASAARAMATDPLGPLSNGEDPAELAAWTVLASVLLNHDGVLSRN